MLWSRSTSYTAMQRSSSPLVQALLGEEYVVYSCAFVIVQLILLWTHASACLQEGAKLEWKKILTNVNLIAIVAGALLYLLHISLPLAYCEYAQQRRCYDRTYGYAAGRYGDCRSTV